MCGWGRTSMPCWVTNSAGPTWSKKMNGPTICRAGAGRALFLAQCAACHTLDGYQAIRPLLPDDPDMIFSVVYSMYDQAEPFLELEAGAVVDKTELDYPFMPPFVGNEDEIEQLTEYLATLTPPPTEQEASLR